MDGTQHRRGTAARSRSSVVRTHRASGRSAAGGASAQGQHIAAVRPASGENDARGAEGSAHRGAVAVRSHAQPYHARDTSTRIWERVLSAYEGCIRRLSQDSVALAQTREGTEARHRADESLGHTRTEMQSTILHATNLIRKAQGGLEIVPSLTRNTQTEVARRRHRSEVAQRAVGEWLPSRGSRAHSASSSEGDPAPHFHLRRVEARVPSDALPCDFTVLTDALKELVGHLRLLRGEARHADRFAALLTSYRHLQENWQLTQAEPWASLATKRPLHEHRARARLAQAAAALNPDNLL